MKCPKCGSEESRVTTSIADGLINFRYRKCKACGWNYKTAEMSFSTLNQADIADTDTLERRVKHLNRSKAFKRKISLSPEEIIYGKSEK